MGCYPQRSGWCPADRVSRDEAGRANVIDLATRATLTGGARMAGEIPHDTPSDAGSTDAPAQASDSRGDEASQSVWRTDWQALAIAWGGGWLFGVMLLAMAFTLEDANTIAGGGRRHLSNDCARQLCNVGHLARLPLQHRQRSAKIAGQRVSKCRIARNGNATGIQYAWG